MNSLSLNCALNDYVGYAFVFGSVASMLTAGSVSGYIYRHRDDKRRFTTSNFLGEMFISNFVGMVILVLCITSNLFTFNSATLHQLIKENGIALTLVAFGGYFSPLIVAIVEKKIQEKLGPWLDRKLSLPVDVAPEEPAPKEGE